MFVRKVGSVQSRNTTASASWPRYKAVRKTWRLIFLGQSSNSSLASRPYSCSRLNIVDSRIESTSRRKSRKKKCATCVRVDSSNHAIDLCRRRFRHGSSVVQQPRKHSWVGRLREFAKLFIRNKSQGSSVVEQGTHKPLVGSSNLPPGSSQMGGGDCRLRIGSASGTSVL